MSTLVSWVLAVVLSFLGVKTPPPHEVALHSEVIQCNFIPKGMVCSEIKNEQLVSNDTF